MTTSCCQPQLFTCTIWAQVKLAKDIVERNSRGAPIHDIPAPLNTPANRGRLIMAPDAGVAEAAGISSV